MTRRSLILLGPLVLMLLVVVGPSPVRAQDAAGVTVDEVGWWSSQPTALAQPDKGFQVAAGPQGDAQSVAAIRITIAASHVDDLQVRLVEASGGAVGTEFGALRVCTTTAPWSAANPGPLADAPPADCTVNATLTRTTDGSWLGDLTALVPNGGTVSLVIAPTYQPPTPIGPGMIVTIGGGEFTASGSSVPSTTDTTTDPGGGAAGVDGAGDPYGSVDGGDYTGGFGVGSFEVAPPMSSPAGPTTTVAPATTPTDPGEDDFALAPIAGVGGGSRPWARLVILVPLCAGLGVGSVRVRRRFAGGGSIFAV